MNTLLKLDAEKFAQFIVENYPDAKQWGDPVHKTAWYIDHGFMCAVCDEEGTIMAVVACRPVERPGLGVIPAYFNRGGTCLHCDLLVDITDDNRALMTLKTFCQLRFPQCTTIAMFRHFEEHIRVYSLAKFWKSFEKIKRRKRNTHELATT